MPRRSGPRYMQSPAAVVPMGQALPTEVVGDVRNMIVNSPGSSFGFSDATGEVVEPMEDETTPVPDRWVVECPNCDRPWPVTVAALGTSIPCLCSFEVSVSPPKGELNRRADAIADEENRRMEESKSELERRTALREEMRGTMQEAREHTAEVVAESKSSPPVETRNTTAASGKITESKDK